MINIHLSSPALKQSQCLTSTEQSDSFIRWPRTGPGQARMESDEDVS
jgi:hypothetical protein